MSNRLVGRVSEVSVDVERKSGGEEERGIKLKTRLCNRRLTFFDGLGFLSRVVQTSDHVNSGRNRGEKQVRREGRERKHFQLLSCSPNQPNLVKVAPRALPYNALPLRFLLLQPLSGSSSPCPCIVTSLPLQSTSTSTRSTTSRPVEDLTGGP